MLFWPQFLDIDCQPALDHLMTTAWTSQAPPTLAMKTRLKLEWPLMVNLIHPLLISKPSSIRKLLMTCLISSIISMNLSVPSSTGGILKWWANRYRVPNKTTCSYPFKDHNIQPHFPLLILNIWVHAMHLNLIIANEISQSINQFMFKWVDVLVAITTPIKNSTLKPIYPHSLWMLHQIARPRHYHWKVHSVLQQCPVQNSCLKPRIDVTCCTINLVSSAWSLFMWDAKKTEGLDQLGIPTGLASLLHWFHWCWCQHNGTFSTMIPSRNNNWWLVVDTTLESSRAPINKLDNTFYLDDGHSCIHALGRHITSVYQTACYVLAMAWVTCSRHRRRLKGTVDDLWAEGIGVTCAGWG